MSTPTPTARTGTRDDHPPTLDQVAELAGVSRSTASRAINGGLRVSPEAQSAVDAAVAQLGYFPNRAARTLVTRRTDSVALVIPEPDEWVLSDPFFAGVLRGVSAALASTELVLVLLTGGAGKQVSRTVRYLRRGHVDGAVVVSHHRSDALGEALRVAHIPSVFIGRPWDHGAEVPYVDVDNVGGARLVTEHLIERGRRRIGTITGPADMSAGVDRLTGWRSALRAHGLADDAVAHGDFTRVGGAAAAARLLEAHPDLDAVFAASDLMAAGALAELARCGRRVPDDVAVAGFDDIELAGSTTPPLTTVVNPAEEMARAAGELLVEQLGGTPVAAEGLVFEPVLVVRASS